MTHFFLFYFFIYIYWLETHQIYCWSWLALWKTKQYFRIKIGCQLKKTDLVGRQNLFFSKSLPKFLLKIGLVHETKPIEPTKPSTATLEQ